MDSVHSVAEIFKHLDGDNIEAATMACLRVARASQDHLNAAFFLRELYPRKTEVERILYEDMRHLKEEALKFVLKHSLERWLEVHTMDYPLVHEEDEDNERTVLEVATGEIESQLRQWGAVIAELKPPAGLTAFDAAAFHDAANRERATIRLRLSALQTIKARLKIRCLNYAIQMERQLLSQDRNQALLWTVQNDVNNYFKEHSSDVFYKLQKASDLAGSDDEEDTALLLTEVRRALKAAADHFYPPRSELVICTDGKERMLADDRYLDRLHEYLAQHMGSSKAGALAKAELDLLAAFMRRLNSLASKGVHDAVTQAEARQGLVSLFLFLSTVTQTAPSNRND
ncbi:hypothetical protein OSH11_06020 [Kaistia dalseonensis]|uniref:Uncharacterized protein n=1 Tax=Kaistia dalseonensis TaxID=410840 RepID=A0ABU0H479_9HYPH|nr:hypothetical protein [Kaistia dalseonensis]MCX5494247.1 hypothetical protein [Kaistia dalseonensis]MDQ0436827.1 hypothetical protein [Kaistia dalseonensis]